jgi:hypothetical protein
MTLVFLQSHCAALFQNFPHLLVDVGTRKVGIFDNGVVQVGSVQVRLTQVGLRQTSSA